MKTKFLFQDDDEIFISRRKQNFSDILVDLRTNEREMRRVLACVCLFRDESPRKL